MGHTFQKIYDAGTDSKIKYDYIHGKAALSNNIDSCNLVLDIDEYLTGDARNQDNYFIQVKSFIKEFIKALAVIMLIGLMMLTSLTAAFLKLNQCP